MNSLAFFIVSTLSLVLVLVIRKFKKDSRPVVRVCQVGGRIGIVLRSDQEKASRKYWKKMRKIEKQHETHVSLHPRGQIIPVTPVYVFNPGYSPYYILVNMCRPEQAVFHVPDPYQTDQGALKDAHRHFFGREWK